MTNKIEITDITLRKHARFFLVSELKSIADLEFETGFNHRGIEKILEGADFRQVTFFAERICAVCSSSHVIAYLNAVEELAEIRIPERAGFIRTICSELERIISHTNWLTIIASEFDDRIIESLCMNICENLYSVKEEVFGNRFFTSIMCLGGVEYDIDNTDLNKIIFTLSELEKRLDSVKEKTAGINSLIRKVTTGLGIITEDTARNYAIVGPVARASGIANDVRKDKPYAAYDKVDWDIQVEKSGDVFSKIIVRINEIYQSIKIIRWVSELMKSMMPDYELRKPVPEIPAGESIGRSESPRGELLYFVKSEGGTIPRRIKIKPPSFVNINVSKEAVRGHELEDAALIIKSADLCFSCLER